MVLVMYNNRKSDKQTEDIINYLTGQVPETGTPGPGYRIRTRPRLSEIFLKLNLFLFQTIQAPSFGSGVKSFNLRISLLYKVFRISFATITTITKWIFSSLSPIERKLRRLKVYCTASAMALAGAYSMPKSVEAAPGDMIGTTLVSGKPWFETEEKITGVSYSLDDNITWMNHSGALRQAKYDWIEMTDPSLEFSSVDSGDLWWHLAEGDIDGQRQFGMLNQTEEKIYLRNTTNGVVSKSWSYPEDFENIRGLEIYNNQVLIYNKSEPVRIGIYSADGVHLDNILLDLDYFTDTSCGISKNNDEKIIHNQITSGFFNVIWTNGTEQIKQDIYGYETLSSASFPDIDYIPETNEMLLAEFDEDMPLRSSICFYEGPPSSPASTPRPSGIGIYRPSTGLWAIKGVTRTYFGGENDIPIYKDFNGDGTKEIGIFRPSSGLWAIKGVTRTYFGGSDDKPVPADYNGDNTSDVGIFRPNTGLWAAKGITRTYFGGGNDEPVPGDYNGKGAEDIGIYRGASGLWAIRGVTRSYFGGSSDEAVAGDYAGDGTTRIGIFRGRSGLWAIKGVTRSYFGGAADEPVPGDYAGDGTEDIGIFRDTSGLWAIREVTRAYFGGIGDIPVGREGGRE